MSVKTGLCVFVAGWRHALRSEWPFIIFIFIKTGQQLYNDNKLLMITTNGQNKIMNKKY